MRLAGSDWLRVARKSSEENLQRKQKFGVDENEELVIRYKKRGGEEFQEKITRPLK